MNSDWLKQLAPGHAPSPPGWWPPAPGWWGVAVLCIVVAVALFWWARDPRRALRRTALRQLRLIQASDADGAAVARGIQNLLRRYALTVFGHEQVAKLTGESWLRFMIAHGGGPLTGASGRSLLTAAFGNYVGDDRDQWAAGAEGFIRRAKQKVHAANKQPGSHAVGNSPANRNATAVSDEPSLRDQRRGGQR
jgi:uncharacterized protein DUF4381